jgi:hypothetical protein
MISWESVIMRSSRCALWHLGGGRSRARPLRNHHAPSGELSSGDRLYLTAGVAAMRQSEFDKINAALDRAEFAVKELQKKANELRIKRASAGTPEAIEAVDLEAAELLQELRIIRDAVHIGNPAPHLRLLR